MENSKPLSTQSFSYSWLADNNHHSYNWLVDSTRSPERDQDFNFDVSFTSLNDSLVHADEIFSDGHIMPLYVERSKAESALERLISATPLPIVGNPFDGRKRRGCFVERWRRSYKRILKNWCGLIRPLYEGCLMKSSRVDDIERIKFFEVRPNWSDFKKISNEAAVKKARISPRISPARASSVWFGDESSIHEAILYCKRSIEK